MISRRFLIASSAAISACGLNSVYAQQEDPLEKEIKEWANDPELNKGSLILPPSSEEAKAAAQFLERTPRGGRPIDTVRWLAANTPPGKLEWPADTSQQKMPANPVIVAFFTATSLSIPPKGDETHWCAALTCWAMRRAGLPHPKSAASAAFRTWGTQVDEPEQGDIVVFENKSNQSFGHVGFFYGFTPSGDGIQVFGGNQSDRINRATFARNGGSLKLHSFRTAPNLRV